MNWLSFSHISNILFDAIFSHTFSLHYSTRKRIYNSVCLLHWISNIFSLHSMLVHNIYPWQANLLCHHHLCRRESSCQQTVSSHTSHTCIEVRTTPAVEMASGDGGRDKKLIEYISLDWMECTVMLEGWSDRWW